MEYFDKELLEAEKKLEWQSYTTLETGMYVGEEFIEFTRVVIPDTKVSLWLPRHFVPMPESTKKVKYPTDNAPDLIITSLNTLVNIGFSLLPVVLEEDETKSLRQQFQRAITNVNPSIKIQNHRDEKTNQGNEMSWFEFGGYSIDGQSYNRFCLIKMKKNVFHGIFNCDMRDRNDWIQIVDKLFKAVEEEI